MRRRAFFIAAASLPVMAFSHTPYRQWAVYRQKNLLILTSKTEPGAFQLGKKIAARLAAELPKSRARVARAPDDRRVASLLSSKQLDVALLPPATAQRLATGALFNDYAPIALRAMLRCDHLLLVCTADFPDRHAYLITKTLTELAQGEFTVTYPEPGNGDTPALHAGAVAYRDRLPPPAPLTQQADTDHDHSH